ncbi:MAG: isopentenyl-diphosphate Delta-isomerase [Candidatus Thiosymbion ectosymbiont of Robbea hypermnestra]|nr:isopentenyl-diphosphate Delta-isomerase [Candidatus Thiosymbion ectosymbiont of Robbea hypermnestra]
MQKRLVEDIPLQERVVLVDPDDRPVGSMEKLEAHRRGLLHRAFSVFVFRQEKSGPELLLQRRHSDKYHSRGLWTNSCCSHPRPGEDTIQAGERRLMEEMGIRVALSSVGHFIYEASLENGLTEHELDHVLIGRHEGGGISPHAKEVSDWRWADIPRIRAELKTIRDRFTVWFPQAFELAVDHQAKGSGLDLCLRGSRIKT